MWSTNVQIDEDRSKDVVSADRVLFIEPSRGSHFFETAVHSRSVLSLPVRYRRTPKYYGTLTRDHNNHSAFARSAPLFDDSDCKNKS